MNTADGVTEGWICVWSESTGKVYASAPVAALTLDGETTYIPRGPTEQIPT